jgi:archaellum component FlaC
LNYVQAQVATIREDVNAIKARMTSLDHRVEIVHTDMALFAERMDRLESQMGRVQTPLNLSDA